jgi:hypothetical protein
MIDYEATFVNTDGAFFPDTLAVNVSAPGAGDGTEFVAAMVNDIWGRAQSLLDYAGLSPDGVQEVPGTAQILEAIGMGFGVGPGVGVIYWKNDTPAAWGDRVLLLQGQVVLITDYPLLVTATYCGDGTNATAPAFYKTSDAGGTTRSTAGAYFVLPDARGLSLKNIGNATVNTRTKTGPAKLGEKQEDQMQGHYHNMLLGSTTAATFNTVQAQTAGTARTCYENTGAAEFGVKAPITDGTNGTPRTGTATRDSSMGTNYGITY